MILTAQRPIVERTGAASFELTPHQQMILMPMGDIHAYAEGWPRQRVLDHIAWGTDRGAWFLGMGEYFDFTSTTQRAILQQMRLSQRKQLDDLVRKQVEAFYDEICMSVGSWLGMIEGHHYYTYADGTTTDQHLCRLLGCPFLGTSTLYSLGLRSPHGGRRSCTVTLFAHHGPAGGGGRRPGTPLNRLADLVVGIDADIYLMGHTHSKVADPMDRLYRTRDGFLYHRTIWLARTGGFFVGYFGQSPRDSRDPAYLSRGSYAEQAALNPSALGGLVFSIGMKRLRVRSGGKIADVTVPDIHCSL